MTTASEGGIEQYWSYRWHACELRRGIYMAFSCRDIALTRSICMACMGGRQRQHVQAIQKKGISHFNLPSWQKEFATQI